MTITEWADWVVIHQNLFWMKSDDDNDLMKLWRDTLIGYEFADLRAASIWISANESSAFRTKHLQMLLERVRTIRSKQLAEANEAARSQAESDDERNRCIACPGTGIVEVPAMEHVIDNEWVAHGNASSWRCGVTCGWRRRTPSSVCTAAAGVCPSSTGERCGCPASSDAAGRWT